MGDAFVSARDGSKLVRIRNREVEVIHFTMRTPPTLSFRVTMPRDAEPSQVEAVAKKTLCGLICGPLINPLNGKTVGPNREVVKAIARIALWNGKEAEVWIDEEYFPVQPGDVLADLHTWEANSPRGAGAAGAGEWWTLIENGAPASSVPLRKDAPAIERNLKVAVTSARGVERLNSVEINRPARPAGPRADGARATR